MTAKEWLYETRNIDSEVKVLQKQVNRLLESATRISPVLSDEPHGSSLDPHKFDQYVEFSEKLQHRQNELIASKQLRMDIINQVSDSRYRTILIGYFINCDSMEQVAVDMNYSWRHVNRLFGYALLEVRNILTAKGIMS